MICNTVDKGRLIESFKRYACSYDRFAVHQSIGVDLLVREVDQCLETLVPGPALEIGCGTGLLSGALVQRLKSRQLLLSDLTPQMLDICRMNLAPLAGPQVRWQVLDGEVLEAQNKYALIVSAFVLHWFQNPVQGLERLIAALRPGGWLLCVYQGNGSYPEWRQCCERSGIPWTANTLPKLDKMQELLTHLKPFVKGQCWNYTACCSYASARDFFRHMKCTGTAVAPKKSVLGMARLRQLITAWDASSEPIQVTHHLHFIKVQRLG